MTSRDKTNVYILAVGAMGVTAATFVLIQAPESAAANLPGIFFFASGIIATLLRNRDVEEKVAETAKSVENVEQKADTAAKKADAAAQHAEEAVKVSTEHGEQLKSVVQKIDENTATTDETHAMVNNQHEDLVKENTRLGKQLEIVIAKLEPNGTSKKKRQSNA